MSLFVDKEKCTNCGVCKKICPVEAIIIKDGKAFITIDCVEYGACISVCPTQAIFTMDARILRANARIIGA